MCSTDVPQWSVPTNSSPHPGVITLYLVAKSFEDLAVQLPTWLLCLLTPKRKHLQRGGH